MNDVIGANARAEMSKVNGHGATAFALENEQLKYHALHLTEYDRVLVIDGDFLVLDPMDEIMNLDVDFIATYDPGLGSWGSLETAVCC